MLSDTIFAPLTIKGKCSIYVIRISGNQVLDCLGAFGINKPPKARFATLCHIKDGDELLDEALLLYFPAPNSFTGEDVCELNLHCSSYIIERVFSILSSVPNVRMAENGEFSRRAFLNNKFDCLQAEGIADLIAAETKLQHSQAMRELQGVNSNIYNTLRANMLNLLSNLEVLIDFPDDVEEDTDLSFLTVELEKLKTSLIKLLADGGSGEKIKNGLQMAIIGEPNVGKSSLINYLAQRDVAIVSSREGTTRDVLETSITLGGIPTTLFDTAGIRNNTEDEIEAEGIKRALNTAKTADVKLLLLAADKMLAPQEIKSDKNTIIILNKIDLLQNFNREAFVNQLKNLEYYGLAAISLKDKTNLDELHQLLEKYVVETVGTHSDSAITRKRHRDCLQSSLDALNDIQLNEAPEIIAEKVRLASFALGKITGHITSEDILDNIFSTFCIGK